RPAPLRYRQRGRVSARPWCFVGNAKLREIHHCKRSLPARTHREEILSQQGIVGSVGRYARKAKQMSRSIHSRASVTDPHEQALPCNPDAERSVLVPFCWITTRSAQRLQS